MKGEFRRRQAVRQTVCLVSKPKGSKLSPSSPQESGALSGRWSAVHTVQYPIILHILPVFKPVFLLPECRCFRRFRRFFGGEGGCIAAQAVERRAVPFWLFPVRGAAGPFAA